MKLNVLMVSFFFLFCCSFAFATTGESFEIACPVCNNTCYGADVYSSNSFGGVDMDLMRRPNGGYVFLISPITCEKCLFSGFKGDFKDKIDKKLKNWLLGKNDLGSSKDYIQNFNSNLRGFLTEGMESDKVNIPAWSRYELIKKIHKDKFSAFHASFNLDMSICWAIRLEENPLMEAFFELAREQKLGVWPYHMEKFRPLIKDRKSNRALIAINLYKEYLEKSGDLPEKMKFPLILFSLANLRTHGESKLINKYLPKLKSYYNVEEYDKLAKEVVKANQLETSAQKNVLESLKKIFQDENHKWQKGEKGYFTYLQGELSRRCQDYKQMKKSFTFVVNKGEMPPMFLKHCNEQLELLK